MISFQAFNLVQLVHQIETLSHFQKVTRRNRINRFEIFINFKYWFFISTISVRFFYLKILLAFCLKFFFIHLIYSFDY